MNDKSELQIEHRSVKCLQHYTAHMLTLLKHVLIWPHNSFSMYKYIYMAGLVITLLVTNFLLIISEIAALYADSNLQRFASIIGSMGLHATGLLKWSFCIKNNKRITDLMDQLEKCHLLSSSIDNQQTGTRKYAELMEETRSNVNIFLYFWSWCCGYGVLHWCTNPFVIKMVFKDAGLENSSFSATPENMLPFLAWYPWVIHDSNNYYYTYLFQVWGGIGSAFGVISFDVLYISLLMFATTQLRYLSISLSCTDDRSSDEQHARLEGKLRRSVIQHFELTKFLMNLEELFNPVMFVQCLDILTVICLLSFETATIRATADAKSMMILWSILEYFLVSSLQLYTCCFCAAQIKYLGLEVANSAYSCGWENASYGESDKSKECRQVNVKDIKYLVSTMILRAQKPILLTGGPFYELSLETFKAIIGMAISNSLILRQVVDVDQ